MNLRVTKMIFLDNGAISVEVHGNAIDGTPRSSALDNVSVRVYVPKSEVPPEVTAFLEKAIAMARTGLR
jgi:hypothetical protein